MKITLPGQIAASIVLSAAVLSCSSFTLRPAQLNWEFLSVDGTVRDSGLDTCR